MSQDRVAAAAVLEREAGALAEVLDAVAAAAGPATWQGPAADEFERVLEEHRRVLRAIAEQMRATARRAIADPTAAPPTAAPPFRGR